MTGSGITCKKNYFIKYFICLKYVKNIGLKVLNGHFGEMKIQILLYCVVF